MKIQSPTAIAAVLLLAVGLCGLPYTAKARAHRRQPNFGAVQSNVRIDPIKSDIKVYLDGKEMETVSPFDDASTAPIIVDGHLLIPIRFVKEHLAKELLLDKTWGIIELQFGLLLRIGSNEWHGRADFGTDGLACVAGTLPVAPHEIRGRLYMPVDAGLFQQMRLTFAWNPGDRTLRFTHRRLAGSAHSPNVSQRCELRPQKFRLANAGKLPAAPTR